MTRRATRSRWHIDAQGLLPAARYLPSPNRDARPPGSRIELVVLHNISLPPGEFGGDGILELFANRLDPGAHPYYETIHQLRVSAHFLIRRDGGLLQFVPCGERAWHAGVSNWRGRERCNDFSVGIELEGSDDTPFDERQYAALDRLLPALSETYPISGLAGHSEIAPGRKTDPGPFFDWRRVGREPPLQDASAL
jgi:AmpD protein